MVGILIVTHGNLGVEFLQTAEMIMGTQENARALALMYDDDIQTLAQSVGAAIEEMDQGQGIIVFTDLFGGSPNTSVAANLKKHQFQAVTGLNLPMLLECLGSREFMAAEELAAHCASVGADGIKYLNQMLGK